MADIAILLSRILISAVFIVYGWMKLLDVSTIVNNPGTKRFMDLVASGTAPPTWLGYLIAAIEFFGGLAILIGVKTRWVACAFVLYVIIITAMAHPFWIMEGAARGPNMANFYKNIAIIGAFLLLAVTGAGRYSVDHRGVATTTSKPAAATA
ncbi:MAG TPA: DoxX family protein [Xanthobacteraceae bacterium]|jgi:putative oxidoreductase